MPTRYPVFSCSTRRVQFSGCKHAETILTPCHDASPVCIPTADERRSGMSFPTKEGASAGVERRSAIGIDPLGHRRARFRSLDLGCQCADPRAGRVKPPTALGRAAPVEPHAVRSGTRPRPNQGVPGDTSWWRVLLVAFMASATCQSG